MSTANTRGVREALEQAGIAIESAELKKYGSWITHPAYA